MISERQLVTFKRLMVQMLQKYPNPDKNKATNPTLEF